MIKTYLEAGKIINKRGLAGELKIESYCDTPEAFCSFKHVYLAPDGTDVRKVLSAKLYNGYAYIRLEGVTTAEQADKLRGKSLYIHRNDMEFHLCKAAFDLHEGRNARAHSGTRVGGYHR